MEKDLTSITQDQIFLIVAIGAFTLLFAVGAVINILYYKKEKKVSTMGIIVLLTTLTALIVHFIVGICFVFK
ncbi:hypothetical protein ABD91_21320 [Lysinibacillus sphaericus]|uniref:hypothetical protein n=1 Tax=Lysinibacillus sphaericus TaxID=1421 RepID=UPI0018CEADBD|nr:hypothetical protein [Lysinibacillus sphaericus]MBG9693279.1 hypothetical protein [Lysinibacillus sphaericus]